VIVTHFYITKWPRMLWFVLEQMSNTVAFLPTLRSQGPRRRLVQSFMRTPNQDLIWPEEMSVESPLILKYAHLFVAVIGHRSESRSKCCGSPWANWLVTRHLWIRHLWIRHKYLLLLNKISHNLWYILFTAQRLTVLSVTSLRGSGSKLQRQSCNFMLYFRSGHWFSTSS
jgi:hypothetical protein